MKMRTAARICGVIALGSLATASAQDACTNLRSLKLPDTTITEALAIPAAEIRRPAPPGTRGPGPSVSIPAHCRVAGSIKPTADSDIHFEVLLPASNWSQRYQQVGNGGLAGSIVEPAMFVALLRGATTAGTDDGHVSDTWDARWTIGHPEKVIDYGYRAVHLTAVVSEAIVRAYYGQPARHTYFNGCSDGGRESLRSTTGKVRSNTGWRMALRPGRMIATEFKLDRPALPFDIAPEPPLPAGTPIRRTRPICPYPQVAVYRGTGSPDEAENFSCQTVRMN